MVRTNIQSITLNDSSYYLHLFLKDNTAPTYSIPHEATSTPRKSKALNIHTRSDLEDSDMDDEILKNITKKITQIGKNETVGKDSDSDATITSTTITNNVKETI